MKTKDAVTLIASVVVLVGVIGWFAGWWTSPAVTKNNLNAEVRRNSAQLEVTNNDSLAWFDVSIELNGGLLGGGYKLSVDVVESGKTYTVGLANFVSGNGTRFNPLTQVVVKCYISATVNGKAQSGVWSW